METINVKIQDKLEKYQELYDANQRLIYLGTKLDDLSDKYFNNKSKKALFAEVLKVVEVENSKRKIVEPKVKKQKEIEKKELIKEVEVKIEEIRVVKKEKKQKELKIEAEKPKITPKIGDTVRMIDGKAKGTIDAAFSAPSFCLKIRIPKTISIAMKKRINEPATAKEFTSTPNSPRNFSPTKRKTAIKTNETNVVVIG